MKTPRMSKGTASSEYPFYFLETKLVMEKFEGPYKEYPEEAIRGTKHAVKTEDGRVIHKKLISRQLKMYQEGPHQRCMNPRDS